MISRCEGQRFWGTEAAVARPPLFVFHEWRFTLKFRNRTNH
jgi:hypothetical protein